MDRSKMIENRKPIVLILVSMYLPGFRGGGPIRSISNMVERLCDQFEFRIITLDRDLGDESPYLSVKIDDWNEVGNAKVFYASSLARSIKSIGRLMRETKHDVLYVNSFFNADFSLKPLLMRRLGLAPQVPVVLAPRGEFSAGAFSFKRWKKIPFSLLMRFSGALDGVIWHASSDFELMDIRRVIREKAENICVAPNLVSLGGADDYLGDVTVRPDRGVLRVCFLSRISPKKNLDFALRVLRDVKANVEFDIYGPKESVVYWDECNRIIGDLPENISVQYCGVVENWQVRSVISKYDLFFVPTHGENFGHVFIEALSVGTPILVSDQTPWRNLRDLNLGWDLSLEEPSGFSNAIDYVADLGEAEMAAMRACCSRFAKKRELDGDVVNMNRNLFILADSMKIKSTSI